MPKKRKSSRKKALVFFNASVVLAGLHTLTGGSGKLLLWQNQRRIRGVISEIVLDEIVRRAKKIGISQQRARQRTTKLFKWMVPAPSLPRVKKYKSMVADYGDAHLLASAEQIRATFLVSLDKKHVLGLHNKIKGIQIVSPKQLIEVLAGEM
ncbi:MAG: PIN domain-containing protein [Candidatus Chisholmbacteria bacterium]|nr:PIN domain-containing protein [Candidatus Chisholmbacteria bacterium]